MKVNPSIETEPLSKLDAQTQGVKTLLGDSRKAVIKLAIPMIIAMSAYTIYNLVDALWVSGLGADFFTSVDVPEVGAGALAAVGFVLPFFMMIISISTGLGIGGGSAISRRIGSKDKEGADNVAIHTIIITILISIVFSIILFIFAEDLFILIGAKEALGMAISYGKVIFAGSIVLFFTNVAFAILRGEGDAKRAMYAMIFGAVINIVIDPIFIYTFGYGVTGAAYATVLSMIITSIILIYWLFFRKDTYVSFRVHGFKLNKDILKDIFKVGLPASFQQLSMSITLLVIIKIIDIAGGGEAGVAIYNTGWRVVMIAILPLLGLATAVTSVTGAAFGANSIEKINTAYLYAIKFGFIIEILVGIAIFVFSPLITAVFTTSPDAVGMQSGLEMFLMITCLFYPSAAFGIASSAMFQGTGKGTYSLIATLLRTIVFTIVLALISTYIFNAGVIGIWWAIVIANVMGSSISFIWGKIYINKLRVLHKSV